ncbi:MAG TPA: hypothetical protein V6C81_27565 [Planktothrix sp.]|jgi:hypothetical protein
MLGHFHTLKRAVRFCTVDDAPLAHLELNAIIDWEKEHATRAMYCMRGRIKQMRGRPAEAVADYVHALCPATPGNLNQRNTLRIVQNIIECSMRLGETDRAPLHLIMRKEFDLSFNDWFPNYMEFAPNPYRQPTPVRISPRGTGCLVDIGKYLLDPKDLQKLAELLENSPRCGIRRLTTYRLP